jgi:F0F1-type ATP synthase membrane subunit b/b'
MRIVLALIAFLPATALASAAPTDGINWFKIGDPHNLAMGWFILNFMIFIGGVTYVIRGPILRAVRARADRFEELLNASERAREAAEKRQAELQAKLDGLSLEIDALRENSLAKLGHEKELIIASAELEIKRMQKNAEIALERQRAAAQTQLTAEAARLAIASAAQRVAQLVDSSDQARLSDEFVVNMEGEA